MILSAVVSCPLLLVPGGLFTPCVSLTGARVEFRNLLKALTLSFFNDWLTRGINHMGQKSGVEKNNRQRKVFQVLQAIVLSTSAVYGLLDFT